MLDSESGTTEIFVSLSGGKGPAVRFGQKYRERLDASTNLTYATHANLTGLDTDGQRVLSATVTNYAGYSASVKARQFILAMGGIENSRILLWCNDQAKGKLVDPQAPLGRYWMEHPLFSIGSALIDLKPQESDHHIPTRLFGVTDEVKRNLSILGCTIVLQEVPLEGTKGLLSDLLCVAPKAGEWIAALAAKNLVCGARVSAGWEQEPRWENHVKLSETEHDQFGIPLTELHWNKSDRDFATLQKSISQFNQYVIDGNHGRLRLDDWVFGEDGPPQICDDHNCAGYHHMGGTRMAHTVQNGVVDSNCRVFGQENLYVAGSSVFPTGGNAGPTLTIVQLALRLAEHLRDA